MKFLILAFALICPSVFAQYGDGYAADDAHNHDGTHVEGQENCGGNYMLPSEIARLGSHTFMIVGQDGANHIIAEHRSGTPPHNYQFVLRVRLDADEMAFYKKLLAESKTLPAFTTIYYQDTLENGQPKQLDRTFFCLQNLPEIFGDKKKKGDAYAKLFPIRASLLKNADHETDFDFLKVYYPGSHFTLERDDVELMVYRYLPAYLPQDKLKAAIRSDAAKMSELLSAAPLFATEEAKSARARVPHYRREGARTDGAQVCGEDYYLKGVKTTRNAHTFILLNQLDATTVLAVNYADPSPHNYQMVLKLKLEGSAMKAYQTAKSESKRLPVLSTGDSYLCLSDLRKQLKSGKFRATGKIYKDTELDDFKLGAATGEVVLTSKNTELVVNRPLISFLDPGAIFKSVTGKFLPSAAAASSPTEPGVAKGFVDVQQVNSAIQVEARYNMEFNFYGARVPGYESNKCYLTEQAAKALSDVQKSVEKQGYSLLVFDCYRPQRAVTAFVDWVTNSKDQKMKKFYYPEEDQKKLIDRGYINARSGHSRGSSVDLTLIKKKSPSYLEAETSDCRYPKDIEATGQIDMGTTYDCFSDLSNTSNPGISKAAAANRQILKQAMEKAGFINYKKEWWHFALRNEPFKDQFFDFPVK